MTTAEDQARHDEQERMILDAVDKFLARDVAPYAQKLEHDDIWPADIVDRMKELGLFGCIIPEEYGGLGLAPSTYAKVIERISRVWMSVSGIINSHLIMSRIVDKMGTPEQKTRFDEIVQTNAQSRDSRATQSGRIFIVGKDGQPQGVSIRIGATDGATTEVVSGLNAGAEVIVGGGPRNAAAQRSPRLGF